MKALLLIAYPVLVHLAVVWGALPLEWMALVLLCALPQLDALRAGRVRNWLLLVLLAAAMHGLVHAGGGIHALFLPPIVVPAALLAVFAGSLRKGEVPLVTRIAQATRGPLDARLLAYTRQVTGLWVLVLGALALGGAGLAVFAPLGVWSLFSNGVNYLLVGLVFALEYLYRRQRFPDHGHPGFLAYLRLVAHADYRAS